MRVEKRTARGSCPPRARATVRPHGSRRGDCRARRDWPARHGQWRAWHRRRGAWGAARQGCGAPARRAGGSACRQDPQGVRTPCLPRAARRARTPPLRVQPRSRALEARADALIDTRYRQTRAGQASHGTDPPLNHPSPPGPIPPDSGPARPVWNDADGTGGVQAARRSGGGDGLRTRIGT
jgi:hypothetical protein